MKQSLRNLLAADVDITGKVCGGCFIKNKKLKENCLEIHFFFFFAIDVTKKLHAN